MSFADGAQLSQARLRRLGASIPAEYSIFKSGSTYYAEANISGGTDYNSTALHTLINSYVVPALSSGGTIQLKQGTYTVAGSININDDRILLRGDGWGTILDVDDGVDPAIKLLGVSGTNIVGSGVANLRMEMAGITANEAAIRPEYAQNWYVENVEITNSKDYGIYAYTDAEYGTISGCYIHDCGDAAIGLEDGYGTRIRGCHLVENKFGAYIYSMGTHGGVFTSNIRDNTDGGIYVAIGDVHIVGNDVSGNGNYGVYQKTGAGLITGNQFARMGGVPTGTEIGGYAIEVDSCDGLTITGNEINHTYYGTGTKGDGIYVSGSTNVCITGNTIWDIACDSSSNTVDGVELTDSDDIVISGNQFYKVDGYGIRVLDSTCNDVVVGHNSFKTMGLGRILDAGTNTVPTYQFKSNSALDLSGAATDIEVFHALGACELMGYTLLYSEASSADAGANVRVGRYQDGVALDDDYFDVSTSEVSKSLGYAKHFKTADLTQTAISAGDTVTVGTVGGKTGTGEVYVILKIV